MKILIVLTSVSAVPRSGHRTGTWFEELAAPYYAFQDAGAKVTLASVNGGLAPIDPTSQFAAAQTADTRRFLADPVAREALSNIVRLDTIDPSAEQAPLAARHWLRDVQWLAFQTAKSLPSMVLSR